MKGSKLMFGSSSWHPSRLVRALIAIGLGITGAMLVLAAFTGPSTPDAALAPVANGMTCRQRLPIRPSALPNDLQQERITFATRPRGWCCRSLSR